MGLIWKPIEECPAEGEFLVYLPNERDKFQVMVRHPKVTTIGGNFAFDLTKPTLYAEILTDSNSEFKPE